MVRAKPKLGIARFASAESKLLMTTYSSSGLIPAVSTNQAVRSLQKLSTPCSTGTRTRRDATCICPMFQPVIRIMETANSLEDGNHRSNEADGSVVAGHF